MLLLTLAVVSGMLVYGLIAGMLGTILPEFSRRFQLTTKQMGRLALAQAAGLVFASFAAGPLIGVSSKKTALLLALATVSIGLILLPRSRAFGQITTALFLIDCGGGTIVEAANSLTFEMGPAMTEMTKTNLLNASFGAGGVLTSLIGANFCKGDSARLLRVLLAVTLLALVLNVLNPVPGVGTGGSPLVRAGAVLGNGTFWLVSLLFFFSVAAEVGVWNWLTPHLIAQGISEKSALNILSLGFALGLVIGRLVVVPVLPRTLSPVQVTLAAAGLMTVTTYWMLGLKSTRAAAGVVFAAGLAMSPVFPNCIAITATAFPNDSTALGLALVSGWLGMAVSSPIIGSLAGGGRRLETALLVLPATSLLLIATCCLLLR